MYSHWCRLNERITVRANPSSRETSSGICLRGNRKSGFDRYRGSDHSGGGGGMGRDRLRIRRGGGVREGVLWAWLDH